MSDLPGRNGPGARTRDLLARGLLGGLGRIPYTSRIACMGHVMAYGIGPAAGWLRRAEGHLAAALPDLSVRVRRRIARAALDNAGRSFAEPYSDAAFVERGRAAEVSGPGLPILAEAARAGRPVMLVTGHLGNVHAARAWVRAQGHEMAGLYRPMRDARFNAHYAAALNAIGPMYPQGPAGFREMVRLLRRGGVVGALLDVHVAEGVPLRFFGRPAWTSLAMVELALRTDAVILRGPCARRTASPSTSASKTRFKPTARQ